MYKHIPQGTRKPVWGRGKCQGKGERDLSEELLSVQIASDSSEDSDATCPKCGLQFSEDSDSTWIAMLVNNGLTCPAQK